MSTQQLRINGQRLWQSIMSMAEIGPGEEGGSCRLALTDEDKKGRDLFISWCKEMDCSITIDDMGNIFARREGSDPNLLPIVSGSHLDTQPHGGKFDGVYGVLAALEVLRTLHENNLTTKAPLEVVVWTNEEGARFAPAMIASGVYAGLFTKEYAWSRADVDGKTLGDELKRIGYQGDQVCGEHKMGAFLEAHIEQGPILEANANQIGIVVGGQGIKWYDLTVKGQDSHAGSTPMPGRRDALVAAADIISRMQTLAFDFSPDGAVTVGEMSVKPNSRNTIPGEVFLTIDLRNPDQDKLLRMGKQLEVIIDKVSKQHSVECCLKEIWDKPPIKFNKQCIQAVANASIQLGYPHQEIISGAGHDACQVCEKVPTSMIFVPCKDGLSHNEKESATQEDLEAGGNILLHAILSLANNRIENIN